MNTALKASLLTIGLGIAFASADSNATMVAYTTQANAPARCQAFTPGPSNTIRNRVVGSENIGAPIAVACSFEIESSAVSTNVLAIDMYFSNNSTTAAGTFNCTLLTGWQGAEGAVLVSKSLTLASGGQGSLRFDANDTPDTTDTDLGFLIAGVNCVVPTSGVINDTYAYWGDEDGIENPPPPAP